MFHNIGGKIKGLALIITLISILGSIAGGIAMIAIDEDLIALGVIIIIVGPLISWISSFMLYAFGQLVQNSDILAGRIAAKEVEAKFDSSFGMFFGKYKPNADEGYELEIDAPDVEERVAMLEKLYAKGTIDQDVYRAKYAEIMKEAKQNEK